MKGGISKIMIKSKNASGAAIALAILGVIAILLFIGVIATYNGLVDKDLSVAAQWGKIQSAYERRLDLIPNLVATVKGSAQFEKDTQTQIAALRGGVRNAKSVADMQTVDKQMSSLISGINVQVEAYPDLKTTESFRALQDELAGTENRIKWERDNYNDVVKDYQRMVRSFPSNVVAGMFGFEVTKWNMFESNSGAENPVQVDFSK